MTTTDSNVSESALAAVRPAIPAPSTTACFAFLMPKQCAHRAITEQTSSQLVLLIPCPKVLIPIVAGRAGEAPGR